MTEFQRLMGLGVLLNSALYLSACFVAGLVLHNPVAWRLAIAAMGVTYLSYSLQLLGHWSSRYVTFASIALGLLAGLSLLV
jgi:hypothetical protein